MSYVWCHGPYCHTHQTVDRVRGIKNNKVLRTRKIKQWGTDSFYNYFCSQHCYNEFANKSVEQGIRISPRPTQLETPINNPVKCDYGYTRITKRGVDTAE